MCQWCRSLERRRFCRRWLRADCLRIRSASADFFPQSEAIRTSPRTQVFYEAPHRIIEALSDVVEVLGNARHVVIAREVTKLHEEFLRGRACDVLDTLQARDGVKGEITLLIGKAEEESHG